MILRRMADAIRTQNWFTVIIEIFIVVIGIFLGLQVTEWNEDRKNRIIEAAFLQDLRTDIIAMERLNNRSKFNRENQWHDMQSASEVLFGSVEIRPLTSHECTEVARSDTIYVGRTMPASFIALREAGRTGIIQDKPLATALAVFSQRKEALDTASREIRGINIREKYPDMFIIKTTLTQTGNDQNTIERDTVAECNTEALLANQPLLNDLAYNIDAFDAFLRDGFRPYSAQLKVLRVTLDKTLGLSRKEGKQ